ncbi:MAG: hypothetical protein UX89_C0027G0004 [Parcubacteria group bacterium GW2011_GWA2_47_16]|nr:MAG: hypothetical protein UX89_C0027G0004 [Parcubacteria group bacterium GW2011_GWA2_47_16]
MFINWIAGAIVAAVAVFGGAFFISHKSSVAPVVQATATSSVSASTTPNEVSAADVPSASTAPKTRSATQEPSPATQAQQAKASPTQTQPEAQSAPVSSKENVNSTYDTSVYPQSIKTDSGVIIRAMKDVSPQTLTAAGRIIDKLFACLDSEIKENLIVNNLSIAITKTHDQIYQLPETAQYQNKAELFGLFIGNTAIVSEKSFPGSSDLNHELGHAVNFIGGLTGEQKELITEGYAQRKEIEQKYGLWVCENCGSWYNQYEDFANLFSLILPKPVWDIRLFMTPAREALIKGILPNCPLQYPNIPFSAVVEMMNKPAPSSSVAPTVNSYKTVHGISECGNCAGFGWGTPYSKEEAEYVANRLSDNQLGLFQATLGDPLSTFVVKVLTSAQEKGLVPQADLSAGYYDQFATLVKLPGPDWYRSMGGTP